MHYYVGVDLGQKQDSAAIAVVEKSEERTGFDYFNWAPVVEARHDLRRLERVPLGTPYPEVVARVREVVRSGRRTARARWCDVRGAWWSSEHLHHITTPFRAVPGDPSGKARPESRLLQSKQERAMPVREFVESLAERLGAGADVKKVYGEAVAVGDKTIIPVAKIAYGFGGGSGGRKGAGDEGGGGGGLRAAPAGVIEISPVGTRFVPADLLRPLATAALAGLAAGYLIGRFRR